MFYKKLEKVSYDKSLTQEEENELILLAKSGDNKALDKIIKQNSQAIIKIAHKFCNERLELEDLFQEGCLGVISAVKKFDLTKGNKFITFAHYIILDYISRSARKTGRIVTYPLCVFNDFKNLNKFKSEYESKNGTPPSYEEISKNFSFKRNRIENIMSISSNAYSLDEVDEDNRTLMDVVSNINVEDSSSETYEFIEDLLSCLNEKEKDILTEWSGINKPMTSFYKLARKHRTSISGIKKILFSSKEKVKKNYKKIYG